MRIIFFSCILAWLIALGLLSSLISPFDPNQVHLDAIYQSPNTLHPLGTDSLGRDLLSRLLYALKISLFIGFFSASLSIVIGVCYAFLAEIFLRSLMLKILDALLAIPSLLIIMFFQGFTHSGIAELIFIIGICHWMSIAKVISIEILRLKKLEFYQANLVLGGSAIKGLFKEIFPFCLHLIVILFVVNIAHSIISESTLSFFNLGINALDPSLGNILNEASRAIFYGAWWIIAFPSLLLFVLLACFFGLGQSLQHYFGIKTC